MKKKSKRLIALLLSFLMIISMIPATGLTVEAAAKPKLAKKSASIVIGGTSKIKLKNTPKGAKVTYKSAKKNIASVSKKGKVKGLKSGTTKITVSVKKISKTTKLTYKVTVKKPKLSKSKLSLVPGKTAKLSVKNKPKKANYTWKSSNPRIATANKTGKVTAKAKGTATIKVKVKTAKKTYNLSCKVAVKSISDNPDDVKQTYTITFDSYGGSSVASQTVEKNARATQPTAPTRSGYTFDGWYTAASGGQKFDFNTSITGNITLYAHWTAISSEEPTPTPVTYTITFDSYGGSSVASQTVEKNARATQPTTPTRSGYTFNGWFTAASGGQKFDFNTAITGNITLYAHWSSNGGSSGNGGGHMPPSTTYYTVTFFMNDGTNTVYTTSTVMAGSVVSEPTPPQRTGYTLDGWYLDTELSKDYDFASPITKNLNLYASWDPINLSEIADNDDDGDLVPAWLEEVFGISDSSDDTDGDGISDYVEIYEIGSDPSVADSNQDTDGDGISNYDEVNVHHTNAGKADSDADGLTDYEELFTYHTNPIVADTDRDGINDGDEIKLGTDPNSATDLSTIDQRLSRENIDDELMSNNDAIPSLHGVADTVIDNGSELQASMNVAVSSNRAVIGKGVEATIPSDTELTLSFTIDDPTEYYVILELNDDTGWELVESTVSSTSVSAEIDHSGTYCLVDIEVLLTQLGIDVDAFYSAIKGSAEPSAFTWIPEEETIQPDDPYDDAIDVGDENDSSGSVVLDSAILALSDSEEGISLSSSEPMGQADIVFAIDTTGSMSDEISNVANNIITFTNTLSTVYNVNVNFALVDYRDIVEDSPDSTRVIKNGRSNWFTTTSGFRDAVAALRVDGGGDTPETAIDALEVSRRLDFRASARKFIVLVTDAGYKVTNNYGIVSMDDEIQLLSRDGIIVSVVTTSSVRSAYQALVDGTGGIFADINRNFGDELLTLADKIGGEVSESNWILLDDYQYVALKNPLAVDSGSTDGDGLSDWEELEAPVQKELTLLVKMWLQAKGVPSDMVDNYFATEDGVYVTVYPYKSNPVLEDTDYDGVPDDIDSEKRNGKRTGKMRGYYDVNNANYTMDFRDFSKNLDTYNRQLAYTSLIFANGVYGDGFDAADYDTKNIEKLLKYHGFDKVIDYSLDEGYSNSDGISISAYTDDDISEIGIGYHDIVYGGKTVRVVAVIVRGTDGSIEEWSSNFDMGDPDEWHSDHHKGFYIAEERIREFIAAYENVYDLNRGVDEVVYWVTGHSRGAAISNLLAAKLIDSGKNVVAYTFATPSTTIDSNKENSKYCSIFNFANTNDVIAYVPLSQWGFGRYGITKNVSVEDSGLESQWCATTGQDKYNALNRSLITTAMNRINKSCSNSWSAVFDRAGKQRITDAQYACISTRARRYCDIKPHDYWFSDDNYELYPSTAFVFQLVAEMLAGSDSEKNNVMTLLPELWNSKYMVVILGFVGDEFEDIKDLVSNLPSNPMDLVGDGHAPATYYVLVP